MEAFQAMKNKPVAVLRRVSNAAVSVYGQKGLDLIHVRPSVSCEIVVTPHSIHLRLLRVAAGRTPPAALVFTL